MLMFRSMASFTIQMWHGEHFEFTPSTQYVGGKLSHFDNCDPDRWNMIVLADMVKELGYSGFNKLCIIDQRSVDYGHANLHDINVNAVDDASISSHCVGRVHTRDEEEEDLYDGNVNEKDDDWLQECATVADPLATCSSCGGTVRGSSLADDEASLVKNDDVGAKRVGLADNEAEGALHGSDLIGNCWLVNYLTFQDKVKQDLIVDITSSQIYRASEG
ncbi:hypothetical protein FEM48_Zijuj08G0163300 [Ziziphus jujuba var. spinosa]|uniref:PB1-like domain-containing protein n=1 Tax=Ziziphus jujuba var. spinosa TaxID=714518 RepID=A0A978V044_ZIZJJ|nr:hypothetical protein FEM48_Zijuj08G0163300 [Ziziphus jujuba var. spinosa]